MNIRVGNGYDIHRLVPGRPLILGGQTLEHPGGLGLDGHSDADVLVHAIMDALLGALSLGDIGKYFPPTDPQWKGANSLVPSRPITTTTAPGASRCSGSRLSAAQLWPCQRTRPLLW